MNDCSAFGKRSPTDSASSGDPSWNLTFERKWTVNVRPSLLEVKLSANHGCIRPSSPARTKLSTDRIWLSWRSPLIWLVAANCATPTRNVDVEEPAEFRASARQANPAAIPTTTAMAIRTPRNARRPPRNAEIIYFLFIGGSSTQLAQKPVGLTLVAFFTILIFMGVSYAAALAAVCASEMSADSKLRL